MAADRVPTLTARAPSEVRAGENPWLRPIALFALSRLVVLVAALPAVLRGAGAGPWPDLPAGSGFARVLTEWDGAWYVWVADRGYPTAGQLSHHLSDVAFFPLFPMLIRATARVTGLSTMDGALVVSLLAGTATALVLWHLSARLAGRRVADRAVALFVFFPGAFVLSMAYAEPLMLAASAACLLALLDRRWTLAGLAGLVATATRPNGVAVLAVCAIVAAVEINRHRDDWRPLAAPALAACGVGTYFVYLWIRTGDATAWFRSERVMWHDHVSFGAPVIHHLQGLFRSPPTSLDSGALNDLIAIAGTVFLVAGLVWVWRARWPLAVRAYAAAALIVPALSYAVGPRPRMLLAAFPLSIYGAEHLRRRAYMSVLTVSIMLLVALTYVTTTSLAAVP